MLLNFHAILPEVIILVTVCTILLGDLFLGKYLPKISLFGSMFGLVAAAIASSLLFDNFKTIALGGLFLSDDLAQLLKLCIYLVVFLTLTYADKYINDRKFPCSDFYVLGLLSTLGMMVIVSANSLITIYLGVELISLPIYAMCALQRTNNFAVEAALKYFIMGGIASALLLYGLSILYGCTVSLNLTDIANIIAASGTDHYFFLSLALVFIITGIGFKLAAFPFHMWAPDVYQGAPSAVTMFLSAAPKVAAIGMTFRLLFAFLNFTLQWQQLILLLALGSVIIGNLLAIVQTNIKRLLAYSSISHAGYVLFGILAATSAGYAASLYYIVIYAIMNVAAFGLIVLLSQNGKEIESINDLKGLNKNNPWFAFLMLIIMFSLAGVPPTAGFFAKLLVLKSLVDINMTWIAIIGLVFAVVGAFYYIKIIKIMYFEENNTNIKIELSLPVYLVYSANCLALLYLGIFPTYLITTCLGIFA